MTAQEAGAVAGEPAKPKRAQVAYFLFSNEMREKVVGELKEKSDGKCKLGDVAKEISARWAKLSADDKRVYEDRAASDKERYAEELKAYLEACDPAGALRRKYEHMLPRRPLTAAARYAQDPAVREKATKELTDAKLEAGQKEVDAKVKEMWKAAKEEERRPFEEACAKDKAEFFQKQKEWQETPEFKEIEKAEKEQEERRKAAGGGEEGVEAEKEAKASAKKKAKKGDGKGEAVAKEAATPTAKPTPKKRQQQEEANATPASEAKRGRKSLRGEPAPGMFLEDALVQEAVRLNLESALRNLAARPEVVSSGKKPKELLDALRASGGLVNPAKRALLGA